MGRAYKGRGADCVADQGRQSSRFTVNIKIPWVPEDGVNMSQIDRVLLSEVILNMTAFSALYPL